MTKMRKVFKVFWAWLDELEEKWLCEMAQKGWHLKKYWPLVYGFEKGPQEKVIYKTDFKPSRTIDKTEYLTLFKDAGWEHVMEYMGWHYFKSMPGSTKFPDIFSDKASKIQKYKNLLTFLTSILCMIIIIAATIVFPSHKNYMTAFKWIYPMLILVLGYCVFRTSYKIRKINRG